MSDIANKCRTRGVCAFVLFAVWQVSHTWAHGWNWSADRYSVEWWQNQIGIALLTYSVLACVYGSGAARGHKEATDDPD